MGLDQKETRWSWERLSPRLYHALRFILAGLFVLAGALKLADPRAFAQAVSQYGLVPVMTFQQLEAAVHAPPAPKPAPAPKPVAAPVSAPDPPPAQLPKTGSSLPLLGLAGLISVGFGVALTAIRKLWLR